MDFSPRTSHRESTSNKIHRSNQCSNYSGSTNSALCHIELGERQRSIISHELGPVLTCSMYGRDPGTLKNLGRTGQAFPNGKAINRIFHTAVSEWPETKNSKGKTEVGLTKKLSDLIEAMHSQTGIHAASEVLIFFSQRGG